MFEGYKAKVAKDKELQKYNASRGFERQRRKTFKERLTPGWALFYFVEFSTLLWSYALYKKINQDIEFRYKIYKHPYLSGTVEGYYKTAEFFDPNSKARLVDQEIWRNQGKEL